MDQLKEFFAALQLGGAMIYPLLALTLVAAIIIVEKAFVLATRTRLPLRLLALVETYGFGWDELERQVGTLDRRNYFARFFRVVLDNHTHPSWWVESRAGDEASLIEAALARWLWVLETIVTAAPLLGLLGTITGMIRSFKLFGNQGLVDPSGVTGGVAEALVATGLGLFIALLCLFAYNFFSSRQARLMDEMERLGTRLVDHIRLDAEGEAA